MSESKRPSMVTFAGIMMFMVAFFNLVFAINSSPGEVAYTTNL